MDNTAVGRKRKGMDSSLQMWTSEKPPYNREVFRTKGRFLGQKGGF